ncbi:mRNA-binding ribosome synthesis protein nop7 [Dimargaris cristalligena]|nr:mRNA-binding ribosome synthesis protein nop7 [Dimargaris cristalligena]
MGRLLKKGKSGTAKKYCSRSKAISKLQLTLNDFRRLCILKGIYPREPNNRRKAGDRSNRPSIFYYTKDIQFLAHDPLINKFREHKTFTRKLAQVTNRRDKTSVESLKRRKPEYNLDHLVKERYPTFMDALRDIDDALSLLFLIAALPKKGLFLNASRLAGIQTLCAEFQQYIIHTRSLRKVFLSIKGIYYQAEVQGVPITWLVPYEFRQSTPKTVDLRVMATFAEFYETLIGFINFQLYRDANLAYPPKINAQKWTNGEFLDALTLQSAQNIDQLTAQLNAGAKPKVPAQRVRNLAAKMAELEATAARGSSSNVDAEAEGQDESEAANADTAQADIREFVQAAKQQAAEEGDATTPSDALLDLQAMEHLAEAHSSLQNLFQGAVFYLSRETPRGVLYFLIRAFGGQVGWDPLAATGSPFAEADSRITYQICDRPMLQHTVVGRTYLQPQWVFDSINFQKRMPVQLYAPGKELPPHLSPFVEYREGDYVPEEAKTLAQDLEEDAAERVADDAFSSDDDGDDDEEYSQDEAEAEEVEEVKVKVVVEKKEAEVKEVEVVKKTKKQAARETMAHKKRAAQEQEEADQQAMLKSVMSKRQRYQFESRERNKKREREATETLQTRKEKIVRQQKKQGKAKGRN